MLLRVLLLWVFLLLQVLWFFSTAGVYHFEGEAAVGHRQGNGEAQRWSREYRGHHKRPQSGAGKDDGTRRCRTVSSTCTNVTISISTLYWMMIVDSHYYIDQSGLVYIYVPCNLSRYQSQEIHHHNQYVITMTYTIPIVYFKYTKAARRSNRSHNLHPSADMEIHF